MSVSIRGLRAADVAAADRVYRLAFGTLLGLKEPASFRGDADLIISRARAYPDGAFVAESDGAIIGVSLANNWGSLGILGPVAVLPEYWHKGIAQRLLEPTLEAFARWQSQTVGLFTFPNPGHLGLYQRFGFWPRFLVAVMAKDIAAAGSGDTSLALSRHPARQEALVAGCHALAATAYPGLDLRQEIATVLTHRLGDVLVLLEDGAVVGFAICHCGAGSEGGSPSCYIKFALVRSGAEAPALFSRLLAAAENLGRECGAQTLTAGISAGRHPAHRQMVEQGFRTILQGVAMHRPWRELYDRPEIYAIEDWR
jgi:predicted N-acetyltransferase YhbS